MLPINQNNFKAALSSLSVLVKRGHTPSDVVFAILSRWMALVTPDLHRPPLQRKLAKESAISAFANWLNETDILTGAFWLSSAYAALLDKTQRKESAMYFTPPYLSQRILDNAGEHLFKGKIIDPACGGAAFLAPVALRIATKLYSDGKSSKAILAYIENNLYGVDSDQVLCKLSASFLKMVLADHILAAGYEPILNVHCDNGLQVFNDELGTFHLVLCNPPYRKLNSEEFIPYINTYGHIVRGQPNLYALFFLKTITILSPEGLGVLLTPMSFISGQSFSKLRQSLSTQGNIRRLDLIHDKTGVFLGAEQDAVITTWCKDKNSTTPAEVFSLTTGGDVKYSGKLSVDKSGAAWPTPRVAADSQYIPLFVNRKHDLKSYGFVVRTGSIVVHRDPRKRYKSLRLNHKKTIVPMLWQSDIKQSGIIDIKQPPKDRDRYVDMKTLESPSIVKKPAIAMQRVTSDGQLHRLICAPVPKDIQKQYGGVVGENHVCFIESLSGANSVDYLLLCSILRTKVLDRLFRCVSGATNVSAYELNQLPLPDPNLVSSAISRGFDIEEATMIGFGLKECHGLS